MDRKVLGAFDVRQKYRTLSSEPSQSVIVSKVPLGGTVQAEEAIITGEGVKIPGKFLGSSNFSQV